MKTRKVRTRQRRAYLRRLRDGYFVPWSVFYADMVPYAKGPRPWRY